MLRGTEAVLVHETQATCNEALLTITFSLEWDTLLSQNLLLIVIVVMTIMR